MLESHEGGVHENNQNSDHPEYILAALILVLFVACGVDTGVNGSNTAPSINTPATSTDNQSLDDDDKGDDNHDQGEDDQGEDNDDDVKVPLSPLRILEPFRIDFRCSCFSCQ